MLGKKTKKTKKHIYIKSRNSPGKSLFVVLHQKDASVSDFFQKWFPISHIGHARVADTVITPLGINAEVKNFQAVSTR